MLQHQQHPEVAVKHFDQAMQRAGGGGAASSPLTLLPLLKEVPHQVRDIAVLLMRCYAAMGKMRGVRDVMLAALRDLTHTPYGNLVNVQLFNAYCEVLTVRTQFDKEEVVWLLSEAAARDVKPNTLTYTYLTEIHLRAGKDPRGLWEEMKRLSRSSSRLPTSPALPPSSSPEPLAPSSAMVRAMLLKVVPVASCARFELEVVKAALQAEGAIEKPLIVSRVEAWCESQHFPPSYIMWLLMELEVRCVVDRVNFAQLIHKKHLHSVLLRAAQGADPLVVTQVMAMMDRHLMQKSVDTGALAVWGYSQAVEIESAVAVLQWMSRKGFLLQKSVLALHQKFVVASAGTSGSGYTMERHFLITFVDAIMTPGRIRRAIAALKGSTVPIPRKDDEKASPSPLAATVTPVASPLLDLIVLAYARLGCEREAMAMIAQYESVFSAAPTTNTLNAILTGIKSAATSRGGCRGGVYQDCFRTITKEYGVSPNGASFQMLIRLAVEAGHIDEAVRYLQDVCALSASNPSIRVEAEMILVILERAARAGDETTANRISQFSLDCDVGIDVAVLHTVMSHLRGMGRGVEVLQGHLPLHEALRSRSKVGRIRTQATITL